MRAFCDKNFVLKESNKERKLNGLQIFIRLFVIFLITFAMCSDGFNADLDWRMIRDFKLEDPPIDVVTSFDGSFIFVLTAEAVLVYNGSDNKIVKRIPVNKAFNKLSHVGARNELVLTSTTSKILRIIKIYPIYQINTQGSPFFGKRDAPVTVVVFDDYVCSSCAIFEKNLKDVLEMYAEEVKLVIKNYPGSTNSFSKKAATAARAAHAQGKFREFHQALFEKKTPLDDAAVRLIARKLGLDMGKFSQDWHSKKIMSLVDRDLMESRRLGITATPTVFINGKFLERLSSGDLIEFINAEINEQSSD